MSHHSYEIRPRETGEVRPGHFCLTIDGFDCDLSVDPAQFMPKALLEAAEAGAVGTEQPIKAQAICKEYAERALQRRIDRLKAGSLIPQGLPMSAGGGLDTTKIPAKKRRDERAAVEAYMNRGRLQNLNPHQRREHAKRRAEKFDNQQDWIERRKALIAARQQELQDLEPKAKSNTKLQKQVVALKKEIAALIGSGVFAATHGFQYAYTQYLAKQIDLVNDDIRIWPLMTNTTLDTVRDAVDTFSDVTADEFDGANYSSGGLALDSQAVAVDDANDRAEFDSADETVTALGAGTRSIQGVGLGKFSTNTAASLPLHWLEFASNKTPDGSDFTFVINAEGLLQAADG